MAGCCECVNESSGSVKCDDLISCLSENRLAFQEALCCMEMEKQTEDCRFNLLKPETDRG